MLFMDATLIGLIYYGLQNLYGFKLEMSITNKLQISK